MPRAFSAYILDEKTKRLPTRTRDSSGASSDNVVKRVGVKYKAVDVKRFVVGKELRELELPLQPKLILPSYS
jgi:hypothetical protein